MIFKLVKNVFVYEFNFYTLRIFCNCLIKILGPNQVYKNLLQFCHWQCASKWQHLTSSVECCFVTATKAIQNGVPTNDKTRVMSVGVANLSEKHRKRVFKLFCFFTFKISQMKSISLLIEHILNNLTLLLLNDCPKYFQICSCNEKSSVLMVFSTSYPSTHLRLRANLCHFITWF